MYFFKSGTIHYKIHPEFKNNIWEKKCYSIKCAHKLSYISITETLNCERKVPIILCGGIIIESKSIYKLVVVSSLS